uniref:Uncharacterized protein LOC111122711 isoform X2 n=1 Tax=Crassostrea virginica TaxID=6565 RepID=A0A8B8CYK0_CRAVI|nr:uncharacterized protein LOC111122711 isoform X2 [Crassostrea virginica]
MYTGSSLDVYKPKLVINRIDFDRDDDDVYQCAARNSEGWGTSERALRIDVKGSILFQHQCNYIRECLYGAHLTCTSQQCLCDSGYYHKQKRCYSLSYLQARSITVKSSTCDISINWWPPSRDVELISGYEIFLQEYRSGWRSLDKDLVGNMTHYTTPCLLESGRLYQFFIRSKINLRGPMQEMLVDSSYTRDILEPRKPGKVISSLSNFSADGVHLVWEESDAFVNRYRVEIDGHQQTTLDNKPEIDWNRLLLPVTQYNVTITAISYGYVTNYPSYDCDNSGGEHPCPGACSCVMNHTDHCDPISARCLCLTGWTGDNCSQDVDECQELLIQCNTSMFQVCVNSPGSARCECLYGGLNLANCKHPKPPVKPDHSEIKVTTETTFDIHINREEFLNNTDKWEEEFKSSLMRFYKDENVRGLIDIIILSIRQHMPDISGQAAKSDGVTALVINYEIIGSKKDSPEMKSDLATSMQTLVSGKINITVFDQTPAVKSVAIKDPTGATINNITHSSTPCMVLKSIGGSCPVGQICEDSIGIATCISSPTHALSEKLILVIALGTSIPTTILIIAVFIVFVCRYGKSHKEDNHLENRIGKLEATISKNPYSQEPTSRPEYETPYDSVHSSEDASHVYMELDDVPRPPPSGHAGVEYVNYMKNPRYEKHIRNAKRY